MSAGRRSKTAGERPALGAVGALFGGLLGLRASDVTKEQPLLWFANAATDPASTNAQDVDPPSLQRPVQGSNEPSAPPGDRRGSTKARVPPTGAGGAGPNRQHPRGRDATSLRLRRRPVQAERDASVHSRLGPTTAMPPREHQGHRRELGISRSARQTLQRRASP